MAKTVGLIPDKGKRKPTQPKPQEKPQIEDTAEGGK